MTYVITDNCELHKDCLDVCPVEAVSVPEGASKAEIDADLCTECGECAEVCPVDAPILEEEA